MRTVLHALPVMILSFLFAGCGSSPSTDPRREARLEESPEVKWGQAIAEEFLESVKIRDTIQQRALTTESFQKNLHQSAFALESSLELSKWTVTDRVKSPDGQEVTIKGTAELLQWGNGAQEPRTGAWTITVLKEKESSPWRVNYCRLTVNLKK